MGFFFIRSVFAGSAAHGRLPARKQLSFNGVIYTYIHNFQGDIVGILDSAGALVVEYKYDAWGKPIATTGNLKDTLGKRNPFRYRGYIYDEETGLYYLRSRYYNPEIGRFINADTVLGQVGAICSHNPFAYCVNNPIAAVDPDGQEAVAVSGTGNPIVDFLFFLFALLFAQPTSTNVSAPPQTQSRSTTKPSASPKPSATSAPKVTPNPDNKYWLAVAFGGNAPIPIGDPMDIVDISILLHAANFTGIYGEAMAAASISGVPVAYGVYTPRKEDAHEAAQCFGISTRHDSGSGLKYPHYHGTLSDYENLHFWYSP